MRSKIKSKSAAPKIDPYLEGLMAKLLERLTSLEKKMDAVVTQTASRPAGGGPAPKPFQNPPAQQQPRHDRTMYEAICADCHKVCEVPFRPSEDRAVYCKECFARRKSGVPSQPNGMPRLTPVALPSKPANKQRPLSQPAPALNTTPPKAKKSSPVKKTKKKK